MKKLLIFFKYNNAFTIILGFLFLAAGSSFASEKVRDTVIGQTIEEVKGVDNSALLAANFDSLKQAINITDVTEDEENYNINYSFTTFDIKDNLWQNQTKIQNLRVPKEALKGGKDLGLHVQAELSQIIDSHLAYLKDARDKERKKGETKAVKVTKYTGLKGLVLNSETKELEGYKPVMEKEERKDPPYVATVSQSQSSSNNQSDNRIKALESEIASLKEKVNSSSASSSSSAAVVSSNSSVISSEAANSSSESSSISSDSFDISSLPCEISPCESEVISQGESSSSESVSSGSSSPESLQAESSSAGSSQSSSSSSSSPTVEEVGSPTESAGEESSSSRSSPSESSSESPSSPSSEAANSSSESSS